MLRTWLRDFLRGWSEADFHSVCRKIDAAPVGAAVRVTRRELRAWNSFGGGPVPASPKPEFWVAF